MAARWSCYYSVYVQVARQLLPMITPPKNGLYLNSMPNICLCKKKTKLEKAINQLGYTSFHFASALVQLKSWNRARQLSI